MRSDTKGVLSDCGTTVLCTEGTEHDAEWNEFLVRVGVDPLFFRTQWDDVLSVYGLHLLRLIAMQGTTIVGVLPLVWQRGFLLGNRLVSLPWFDAAGIVADNQDSIQALLRQAILEAKCRGAGELQVRQRRQTNLHGDVRLDKYLMRLPLAADPQTLWLGFKPTVRNQIRKAQKSGLVVERGKKNVLSSFYSVYSENMRDLGSPSHSYQFFEAVLDQFSDETDLYIVNLNGYPIGAGFTMKNGVCLEIPWASSRKRFNSFCVNHIMYWHIIEQACTDGFEWFHFGRSSKDSGQYNFKRQWGTQPAPLYWYHMNLEDQHSDDASNESSGEPSEWKLSRKYEYAARVWKHLPLWLSRIMGPRLIRYLP